MFCEIAKINTLKVKRIAKSLKFDPVNNSSLKVMSSGLSVLVDNDCFLTHIVMVGPNLRPLAPQCSCAWFKGHGLQEGRGHVSVE